MTRPFYMTLGVISLLLGLIGVVLPLLPTTPFVLLAAYCFSKSSQRFYHMLISNKLFGPIIRDWERDGVIPLKVKMVSTTMMVLMISYPVLFKDLAWWIDAIMIGTASIGLVYVWSRPSLPKADIGSSIDTKG
ncbi:MAG: YbaN family protein [Motiliproteus sp.]|nr:YbaN family protein [Motiliproteus sp.]MCW9053691.1 YbaN family protein [Motiliproteus sp.]